MIPRCRDAVIPARRGDHIIFSRST